MRLEQEVVRLRERVSETSRDAAAARILAGGADRDVSDVRGELRAHTQSLNALRETQRELVEAYRELRELQIRQGSEHSAFAAEVRANFAEMRTGTAQIVTLLGGAPPA